MVLLPTLVKVKAGEGSRYYDLYIGETNNNSIWHNPVANNTEWKNHRKGALMYAKYLLLNNELLRRLPELEGKRLGCHCTDTMCHGIVLRFAVNLFLNKTVDESEPFNLKLKKLCEHMSRISDRRMRRQARMQTTEPLVTKTVTVPNIRPYQLETLKDGELVHKLTQLIEDCDNGTIKKRASDKKTEKRAEKRAKKRAEKMAEKMAREIAAIKRVDKRAAEKKRVDKRAAEKKRVDKRAAEKKRVDKRADEKKRVDEKIETLTRIIAERKSNARLAATSDNRILIEVSESGDCQPLPPWTLPIDFARKHDEDEKRIEVLKLGILEEFESEHTPSSHGWYSPVFDKKQDDDKKNIEVLKHSMLQSALESEFKKSPLPFKWTNGQQQYTQTILAAQKNTIAIAATNKMICNTVMARVKDNTLEESDRSRLMKIYDDEKWCFPNLDKKHNGMVEKMKRDRIEQTYVLNKTPSEKVENTNQLAQNLMNKFSLISDKTVSL
uniref:DUF4326 domain-containing protein n=1 Tax=Chionoecetes opilio bacilliform virus TaxID=1825681 RepID=A0A1Q3DM45_9VIRU|nr:hypothetical protein [Chionoecetes opilio bacilliform virus]GAV93258.1 hypothetical protein SCV_138 [Chionoecetes opilio bacilliform virus]